MLHASFKSQCNTCMHAYVRIQLHINSHSYTHTFFWQMARPTILHAANHYTHTHACVYTHKHMNTHVYMHTRTHQYMWIKHTLPWTNGTLRDPFNSLPLYTHTPRICIHAKTYKYMYPYIHTSHAHYLDKWHVARPFKHPTSKSRCTFHSIPLPNISHKSVRYSIYYINWLQSWHLRNVLHIQGANQQNTMHTKILKSCICLYVASICAHLVASLLFILCI